MVGKELGTVRVVSSFIPCRTPNEERVHALLHCILLSRKLSDACTLIWNMYMGFSSQRKSVTVQVSSLFHLTEITFVFLNLLHEYMHTVKSVALLCINRTHLTGGYSHWGVCAFPLVSASQEQEYKPSLHHQLFTLGTLLKGLKEPGSMRIYGHLHSENKGYAIK